MKKYLVLVGIIMANTACRAQTVPEKIDTLLTAFEKQQAFSGAVLVARGGTIIFEKGYGYKNKKENTANDTHTIFQIGSITKQFTSAMILQLEEKNRLSYGRAGPHRRFFRVLRCRLHLHHCGRPVQMGPGPVYRGDHQPRLPAKGRVPEDQTCVIVLDNHPSQAAPGQLASEVNALLAVSRTIYRMEELPSTSTPPYFNNTSASTNWHRDLS